MGIPTLDDGHLLLISLAVAVRLRDAVLVRQVAEKADLNLPDSQIRRSFSKLRGYGVSESDLEWLGSVDL